MGERRGGRPASGRTVRNRLASTGTSVSATRSESGVIEIAPLAFMRGRTLSHATIILDEAQNCTSMQMKMFLTRLGEGSQMIVTGDPSQIDLPSGQASGLQEAIRILENVKGIDHIPFTSADVVRHELVARIVEAYEKAR
jgi:phosphate starvation-inducible PhoH-like protein